MITKWFIVLSIIADEHVGREKEWSGVISPCILREGES